MVGIVLEMPSIKVDRSGKFMESANIMSEFISRLPLSRSENNDLIALMLKQIEQAEYDSFMQGFEMGVKITKEVTNAP